MNSRACLNCNMKFDTTLYNKTYCCKKCQRLSKIDKKKKYQSEHYKKNIAKRKEYYTINKDKIAKTNSNWYIKNKQANNSIILKELCNYTNLQPLWAIDNLKKNNKEYV